MTFRRPRGHLSLLSPPLRHTRRRDPPLRWARLTQSIQYGAAPETTARRHLASVVSPDAHSTGIDADAPGVSREKVTEPAGSAILDALLSSIRRKDAAAKNQNFLAWVNVLGDPSSPQHAAVTEQLLSLPAAVLSEIIRSMDPTLHPELDMAHGLAVSPGQARFTDIGRLVDSYGVRIHHSEVLEGMMRILLLRTDAGSTLQPADFNTLLRCVGAAQRPRQAPIVYGMMKDQGYINHRTERTWIEFLKARFLLDPIYYQFNRANIVFHPRGLVDYTDIVDRPDVVRDMDRIRLAENALLREPWNRQREDPGKDIRLQLRRRRASEEEEDKDNFASFWSHIQRRRASSAELYEELMCVNMMGLARSNDIEAILQLLSGSSYGIRVDKDAGTVAGGKDIHRDSPEYPTARLLDAIVEAFGSMSHISLAMRLVDFVSLRYDIPIPRHVWSNLLNWAYTCGARKLQRLRRIYGTNEDTFVYEEDVIHIWDIMTSPPYSIKPTFQDLDIYIRSLIVSKRIDEAIDLIRTSAMPYHDSLTKEAETALFDEVLLGDAAADPTVMSQAIHRRRRAEIRKDYAFNCIAKWFDDMLRISGRDRDICKSTVTTITIPDLIRSFPQFFHTGARYHIATGIVNILDPDFEAANSRWMVKNETYMRTVLPAKMGSQHVPTRALDKGIPPREIWDEEAKLWVPNPDFEWPRVAPMRIKERRNVPRKREDAVRAPPKQRELDSEWKEMLRTQLMM